MALGLVGKVVGPLVVAGIISGVGYTVSLSSRVSAVEAHSNDQGSHVEHIEKRLDTVDGHLNDLIQAMGRVEGQLTDR